MTLQSTPSVPRPVHHALRAQPVRASGPPRARIDSERYRSLQLPAAQSSLRAHNVDHGGVVCAAQAWLAARQDRKSTRLNSSHVAISYAVFCLKKKILTTRAVRNKHVLST